MLNCIGALSRSVVNATDGAIGHVKEAYFDDQNWAVRYLVVDTGHWLSGREVLISPYAVRQPLSSAKQVEVALTRDQVEHSPPVDTHQPISRRHERAQLGYYAFPEYWGGDALWAMNATPLVTPASMQEARAELEEAERDVPAEDVHLRSTAAVKGYDLEASDGQLGHVVDYVFDDETWALRYLIVDTRNWWPASKRVLIETEAIADIDWAQRVVRVRLTQEQIKNSLAYEEGEHVSRDLAQRLEAAREQHARALAASH